MDIKYVYIKERNQFGKQCFFEDVGPNVEENIFPDEDLGKEYIRQFMVNKSTQKSTTFALHEVGTVPKAVKKAGLLHLEGSWPREINPYDEETVMRFRRRVVKSDLWNTTMKPLMKSMESYILQNNAVNIHDYYFEDMIPTELKIPPSMKVITVYSDQEQLLRPVNYASWSISNQLAVAYCSRDRVELPSDLSPNAYIWNVEIPTVPFMILKSVSAVVVVEFNPRDPSLLISGLKSGQVCCWDTRTGDTPVLLSEPLNSHRNPASQALWISSKTNSEFFSSSNSGSVKWWDIRKMRKPTEVLVMDINDPDRGNMDAAVGVSALQYESTMGSRFLVGLENGVVINVNRRAVTPREKLHSRYKCHFAAVMAVDRNPASLKNFVTVDACFAKIWAEENKESCLTRISKKGIGALTGGCWSRSRMSVFFTIDTNGRLDAYDLFQGLGEPLIGLRVCEDALTMIRPHPEGQLVAVGSDSGDVYVIQCDGLLTTTFPNDKPFYATYLERTGRYEKAADARVKEQRMIVAQAALEAAKAEKIAGKSKEKAKVSKDKPKPSETVPVRDKSKVRESEKLKEKDVSRKSRMVKKSFARDSPFANDKMMLDAEKMYFQTRESERTAQQTDESAEIEALYHYHKKLEEQEMEDAASVKQVDTKKRKDDGRRKVQRSRSKKLSPKRVISTDSIEKMGAILQAESVKSEEFTDEFDKKKRALSEIVTLKTCPTGVCKPEICCLDVVKAEQARAKLDKAKELKKTKRLGRFLETVDVHPTVRQKLAETSRDQLKWRAKIADVTRAVPERSPVQKKRILLGKDAPPSILIQDVKDARKGLEICKENLMQGRNRLKRSISLSPKRRPRDEDSRKKGLKKRASSIQDIICCESRTTVEDVTKISNKLADVKAKIGKSSEKTSSKTSEKTSEKTSDASQSDGEEEETVTLYPRISEAFFPVFPK